MYPQVDPNRFLFTLIPFADNTRAREVIADPQNARFGVTTERGVPGLAVGFAGFPDSPWTLMTLGRAMNGINMPYRHISKLQCTFELARDDHVVMLHDRSTSQTTQTFGQDARRFERGRHRKILVLPQLNTIVGMGGSGRNLVMFRLHWHHEPLAAIEKLRRRDEQLALRQVQFFEAPTVTEASDTIAPSRIVTRIHTPGMGASNGRYHRIEYRLGEGSFGAVFPAFNVDSGKLFAVKIVYTPADKQSRNYMSVKSEIEVMACNEHPHIVNFVDWWEASEGGRIRFEVLMGLKDGNAAALFSSQLDTDLIYLLLRQILKALKFLAGRNIVHRDVKPQNILYTKDNSGQIVFCLGDFGLSKHADSAMTCVGTSYYMAPEILPLERGVEPRKQTPKADVWSLYVTMLWIADIDSFRIQSNRLEPEKLRKAILASANSSRLASLGKMAAKDPKKRASAADMLKSLFGETA